MPRRHVPVKAQGQKPAAMPQVVAISAIPDLIVPGPDAFQGYLTEKDIAEFSKKERRFVLADRELELWLNWNTNVIIELWGHLKAEQAARARDRKEMEDQSALDKKELEDEVALLKSENANLKTVQTEDTWKWTIVKWGGVTLGAGLLSAFAKVLMEVAAKKLWP